MKNVYIVRHSAVVPSDFSKPKDWREVTYYRWSKNHFGGTKLLISSFDHYALQQRNKVDFDGAEGVKVFKTPGYKKTVSIKRVYDAWIFGLKIIFYTFKNIKKKDVVVVSLPTPESTFCLSIARLFINFKLIIDVRDNWPDNFTGKGKLKKLFSIYVMILNKITFRSADKFIWMSDGLKENHKRKGLVPNIHAEEFTIPVMLPDRFLDHDHIPEFNHLFEKPVLAFFGTLNPQFDLSILKSNIDKSPTSKNFNFIIAGSGNQLDYLKDIFSDYKNVFFLGQIPFETTQIISKKCQGFFLYYREPQTYANHITNKLREYANFKKPILHNLDSSEFSIDDMKYKIGCSLSEISLEEALQKILNEPCSDYFDIKSLEKLTSDLSNDVLKHKFLSILN